MANITTLAFSVLFDISTGTPKIILTNLSVGTNLSLCKYWVVITTPSGTPVHTGSLATPDMNGVWATWQMPEAWPQPFSEIEWSGSPYTVTLYVDDGGAPPVQLNTTKQGIICRPNGNTAASKNNFGVGAFTSRVQCSLAKLFAQDATKYLYKDTNGTIVSQTWTLVYPPDNNGFSPNNQVVTGLNYVYFDLTYNAEGYNIFMNTVVLYNIAAGVSVKIAYKAQQKLNVQCGMDLCDLICAYQDLIQKVQNGQCGDQNTADFKQTLLLINSKMNIVLMAEAQGCDVNIPELIADIKKLGGFDCGCANNSGGGGIFPTPINPSTGGACCPQSLPVYLQGTTTPPTECPNSFFPASIFAPDGVTWIGMAYSADDMVSIMNGNPAWFALGTAYPQGNCQVAFIKNANVIDVPPVEVIGGVGTGVGSGTTGTGSTSKKCVNGTQIYLAVLTDSCTGAAITVLPTNASVNYGSGPNYPLGSIASMAALITALNAESHKPASVSYTIGTMPGVYSILTKNTNCPAYSGPISLFGDQFCNIVLVDVIDVDTGVQPANCPLSYFPATVYGTDGTTIIGTAADVFGMIAILNADPGWSALGTASYYTMCQVQFNKKIGVGIIPDIKIKDATKKTCTFQQQNYVIPVADVCTAASNVTAASFPIIGLVDYGLGGGIISLGTIVSWADFIAKLNAEPSKPASLTYSVGVTPDSLLIFNSDCIAYPGPATITALGTSSEFLLYGSNHTAETAVGPTANGEFAFALGTRSVLGRIPGSSNNKHKWHTILINTTLLVAEGDTGKIYFYNVATPLMPTLFATVQLNDTGSGNCFTGLPHTANFQSGAAVPSIYSLYFPTDYHAMPTDSIVVCEGTTGSAWKINMSGVISSFAHQELLGKCPRVLVNNKLYFTQDGDLESAAGLSSGLLLGQIPVLDCLTFNAGGLSIKTIFLNDIEYVWAASYDGTSKIYFTSNQTSVAVYDIPSGAVTGRVLNLLTAVLFPGSAYKFRLNTTLYNGFLYFVPIDFIVAGPPGIPIRLDISTLFGVPALVYFDVSTIGPHKNAYNLWPLGNCLAIVTQLNAAAIGTGYLSIFKLDGTFIATITVPQGQIYNVVSVPGISIYTPNVFVP